MGDLTGQYAKPEMSLTPHHIASGIGEEFHMQPLKRRPGRTV